MVLEGLKPPSQLSSKPPSELFMILTSPRSGSEWVYNQLDQHPLVCASSEQAYGYPAEALLPSDANHLPLCSAKRGCTLQFVLTNIMKLTNNSNMIGSVPRCNTLYRDAEYQDPLPQEHLRRLCNFIEKLKGNYSAPSIIITWVDAYVAEDESLLGCFCPKGSRVKGQKIMGSWITTRRNEPPKIANFHETAFAGSKVIRLKRRNLFERHKSLVTAQTTGLWHARTVNESSYFDQKRNIFIPVDKMLKNMEFMEDVDRKADEWVRKYASDVLWVDYDECKHASTACFNKMFEFLGVEKLSRMEQRIIEFSKGKQTNVLDNIVNKDEVRDALITNGWGKFIEQ